MTLIVARETLLTPDEKASTQDVQFDQRIAVRKMDESGRGMRLARVMPTALKTHSYRVVD